MMLPSARRIARLAATVMIVGIAATSLFAQPGGDRGDGRGRGFGPPGGFGGPGGGFGGRGGGRGFGDPASLGTHLRSDDLAEELGISEDKLDEIRDDLPESSELRELYGRVFRTQDEDERAELRDQIRGVQEKLEADTEAALRKELTPDQMSKLFGIVYREAGPRALTRPEVAEQLKLTDEQRSNLRRLNEERGVAAMQLGFGASQEDRAKFDEEWNEKLTAVLTPEQRQQWQGLAAAGGGGASPAPANAVSPAVASGTGAARPVLSQTPGSLTRRGDGTRSDDVVASFEPPRGEDSAVTPDEQYDPSLISFNFQNAPWSDVLDMFARRANLTLDLLDLPPGTFTYKDTRAYTPRKALDILHGYLLQRGHVMVQRDRFLVVLNIDNRPIPPNSVEKTTLVELQRRYEEGIENELVQVIFPLDTGLDAEQVATQVEGLLGPQRQVVALKAANALAVRDSVANLMNLGSILERMAPPLNPEDVVFKAFALKHILASEAEPHVRSLFGLGSATPNVSSASRDSRNRFSFGGFGGWPGFGGGDRGRGRDDDDDRRNQAPQVVIKPVQVTSDRRTNMLLIAATPTQLAAVEEVIKSIDVPVSDEIGSLVGKNTPEFRVYSLTEAEPDEVAQTLTALMPHVVINDDDQRGRGFVHILATPLEHQKVAEYIRQMEGQGAAPTINTIPLNRQYHPTSVAAMLNQLFIGDAENAPTILGEAATWSLLVKGTPEQLIAVRKFITDMGIEGDGSMLAGNGSSLGSGRFRPIEMNGRDAAKVARRLQDILEGSGGLGNRINVIVPAERDEREGRGEEPAGTPRIRMETPGEPENDLRRLDTQRTDLERSQTDARRGSRGAAGRSPEGLRREDARSAQSPPQETRPLQGIESEVWGPITSFDVPQPTGRVEVDLVPGTGFLLLKGNRRDLDTLAPLSPAANARDGRTSQARTAAATQFVSFQPEAEAAGPMESNSDNADEAVNAEEAELLQVLDELDELLDLEELAEQQRATSEEAAPAPAEARPAAQPAPRSDESGEARPSARRDASAERNGPRNSQRSGGDEVTIEVQGGKLYIYSSDEEALDQVESAVADILSQMPPETIWTVFYLQSADVVDATDMLSQLMPDTAISSMSSASGGGLLDSLSGGISGMTSGLMSMTGLDTLGQGPQTLRIIPDLRSNSLWVSGPVDKVRDVETFLAKLDDDELPESHRDRVPRTIDVYYADVNKVADMVRELYKDYLEDPNQNRNRGNNPLAMIMGGGGSGTNSRMSGIRLTLAVDEQTSQLVVSCSNSLYEQIKRTVEAQDLAAMEARRTVRFVNVDAGSSSVIQETLSRALPNVRVSTTGTPADRRTAQTQQRASSQQQSGGGSPFGGGDRGGGDDDRERAERMRQFMEMRQRQSGDSGSRGGDRGGDRGGSPFGGRTFGGGDRGGFGGGGFPGFGGRGFGGRGGDRD